MKNIVILVSGNGSNLQRIIDCIESGAIQNAQISTVVSDRECFGLERAKKHGISTHLIPKGKSFSSDLKNIVPQNTDLIVLAGFLSILSKEFCEKFPDKIINIHPALLPKFGGKGMWGHHVHEAILEAKEKESGATVHFVTSGIDEGEIIAQGYLNIEDHETPETLAMKVLMIEHDLYPKAIDAILNDKNLDSNSFVFN